MAQIPLSRVQCATKAQFNPASLTGTYQALNGTGFSDAIKVLQLYNGSETISIDISLDGVTDHMFIPPLGTLIVDFQANHESAPSYGMGTLNVARNQILWGKTASQPNYLQIVGYL